MADSFQRIAATPAARGLTLPVCTSGRVNRDTNSTGKMAKSQRFRGLSGVALLIVDEASWVVDELYQAVHLMLAVHRVRIILLSTPFGKR
jgi:hypothetical protein